MTSLASQLQSLVKFLIAQKIRYAILGGIAVCIYGEPRLTADIDVSIILDKERVGEFLKKAKKRGFRALIPNAKRIAKRTGVIPVGLKKGRRAGKFDIIIAENILEYTAIKRGRIKKIDSIRVRFISPEDLVIHKITSSRPRDIEDLKGILIRQRKRLDKRYIGHWLRKIDKANKSRLYRLFKRLSKECAA